jgi:hypothetical protein
VSENKPETKSLWEWILPGLLVLILLGLGAGLVFGGYEAYRERTYSMHWRVTGNAVVVTRQSSGQIVFQGWDAVRQGLGLSLFGFMLCLWGIMCGTALFSRKVSRDETRKAGGLFGKVIGWMSFGALVVGAALYFPVWWRFGFICWGYALLCASVPVAVKAIGKGIPIGRMYVFLVLGIIVGSFFSPDIALGMACGLVLFLVGFAHIVFLRPGIFSKEGEPK